jgi:hypothetical protein
MLSHLAQAFASMSLLLSTQASIPVWPESPLSHAAAQNCPMKAHRHAKASTEVAARRVAVVPPRQPSEVRVISFGP